MHRLYSVAHFEPVMTMTKHTVQPTGNSLEREPKCLSRQMITVTNMQCSLETRSPNHVFAKQRQTLKVSCCGEKRAICLCTIPGWWHLVLTAAVCPEGVLNHRNPAGTLSCPVSQRPGWALQTTRNRRRCYHVVVSWGMFTSRECTSGVAKNIPGRQVLNNKPDSAGCSSLSMRPRERMEGEKMTGLLVWTCTGFTTL